MRTIMIPNLFLLVLALYACGARNPAVLPVQPTPSQPAAQTEAPTVTASVNLQEFPTMIAFSPIHGDQITIQTAELGQSAQGQWLLIITGQKATPCHEIKVQTTVDGGQINIDISARQKADTMCAQVITDFEQVIPFPDLPAGSYQVSINGVKVGEIQV
jgi:hypothetical protein